jgi:ribosomal protein L2
MEVLTYYYKKIIKNLKYGKVSHGGRNFLGRICVHHRGGGLKKNYCLVDPIRRINCLGLVVKLCYDCNRSALLGLVLYLNGLSSFIIASEGLTNNSIIYSGLPDFVEKIESYDSFLG